MSTQSPPDPDSGAAGVRFGCGAVVGLAAGFASTVSFVELGPLGVTLLCLGTALVFGLLAMRRGDRFWERLRDWLWWV
ncbi:MAG: hypothetical protein H6704_11030 [Myxococcales bacterium]|nr:hypothetical protein [Myxococcales bacterium]